MHSRQDTAIMSNDGSTFDREFIHRCMGKIKDLARRGYPAIPTSYDDSRRVHPYAPVTAYITLVAPM